LVVLIVLALTFLEISNNFGKLIFCIFALNFDFNSLLLKSQVSNPSGLTPIRPSFGC